MYYVLCLASYAIFFFLGKAYVYFNLENKNAENIHQFLIEEFRTPEYIITSSIEPTTPCYSHPVNSQVITASCQGNLFSGSYLTDAKVRWIVQVLNTTFKPPNQHEYTFGTDAYSLDHRIRFPLRRKLEMVYWSQEFQVITKQLQNINDLSNERIFLKYCIYKRRIYDVSLIMLDRS